MLIVANSDQALTKCSCIPCLTAVDDLVARYQREMEQHVHNGLERYYSDVQKHSQLNGKQNQVNTKTCLSPSDQTGPKEGSSTLVTHGKRIRSCGLGLKRKKEILCNLDANRSIAIEVNTKDRLIAIESEIITSEPT